MPPAGLCFTDVTFFFLKCRPSYSTKGGRIATRIVDEKITATTNLVNFGPVTPEISWCICMGGECM